MTREIPWADYDIGTIVRSHCHPDDGELLIIGFISINAACNGTKNGTLGGVSSAIEKRLRSSPEQYAAAMVPIADLDEQYPGWRYAIRDGRTAFYKHCEAFFDEANSIENRYSDRAALTPLGYPALTPPVADP